MIDRLYYFLTTYRYFSDKCRYFYKIFLKIWQLSLFNEKSSLSAKNLQNFFSDDGICFWLNTMKMPVRRSNRRVSIRDERFYYQIKTTLLLICNLQNEIDVFYAHSRNYNCAVNRFHNFFVSVINVLIHSVINMPFTIIINIFNFNSGWIYVIYSILSLHLHLLFRDIQVYKHVFLGFWNYT